MIRSIVGQFVYFSLKKGWAQFEEAVQNPGPIQLAKLRTLIASNRDTAFGKAHHFDKIKTYEDFKSRVPIQSYEDHFPFIKRVMDGEKNVLSSSPLRLFETTSGSTSTNKYIPYTEALLSEMSGVSNAWIYDILTQFPKLRGLKYYWSISPFFRKEKKTSGGIPIGMENDMEYLGKWEALIYSSALAVPQNVSQITDHHQWKKVTCSHLVRTENLGIISVWSPTFLMILMEEITQNLGAYLAELTPSHRKNIEARLQANVNIGRALWPDLQLVSCWCDGPAATQVKILTTWFGDTPIQAKGLLATEAAISIPVGLTEAPVVAVQGHFIEFLDLASGETVLTSDLVVGKQYSPIVTTGAGFYRYHLKDVIECVGHFHKTPRIKFLGKLEAVSDLFGEKLSERQARECIEDLNVSPRFAMLVLGEDKRSYDLIIESNEKNINPKDLDNLLRRNVHFDYCRNLGQLSLGKIHYITNGTREYTEHLVSLGMRPGDIKPTHLGHRHDWIKVLNCSQVTEEKYP